MNSWPLRDRLFEAALFIGRIDPDNEIVDKELRRTFIGIKDDLSFDEPKGDEGRIRATLANIDDDDAIAIARRIFYLYLDLRDQLRS
jgi:hypothetical protein